MQYAPTVLIVHPRQGIAKGLARMLQDHRFHAVPLWNAVDAIEHVANLFFDVAAVSDEMPSALPELLFQANGGEWLEVLSFHTPENNVWDMGEFMLRYPERSRRATSSRPQGKTSRLSPAPPDLTCLDPV